MADNKPTEAPPATKPISTAPPTPTNQPPAQPPTKPTQSVPPNQNVPYQQPPPRLDTAQGSTPQGAPSQPTRQHPPITAPLVQNGPPRAPPPQTAMGGPQTNQQPFRPNMPSGTPGITEGISPEYHYTAYQPTYTYTGYYPPQAYEQYYGPPPTTTTTTTTTKKRQAASPSGPNDPFGMGAPSGPSGAAPRKQQPPPPYPPTTFSPMYQNPYAPAPQGQYAPVPGQPSSSPFNPLAPSSYLAPGQMPPAGLPPLPYLPTGLVPEGAAPPKRKRATPAANPLGMPVGEAQPKRRRKSPEDMITDGDPFNFSKWTPSDDVLLKDCIQGAPSFEKIAKTVRFSAKFSAEQIKNRWQALLYDQKAAGEAAAAMAQLPSINRRVLWSEHEEDILRTEVHSTHFVSFQKVLERNRAIFHSSRTAKSLEAHYYRMKRHGTLQKMNFNSLTNSTFSQMEQSLYSSNDGAHFTDPDTLKDRQKQYRSLEKSMQRGTLRMEKELAREKDKRQKLLAIFRGRYLRHEMKSKEILLGRMSSDTVVDVDLSEEGNAAKVSRQQATIKLKRDCEFYLKNIGRRLVFINGKPIEKGKKARLVDGALIEIHNLQFVFEINRGVLNKIKKAMQG